MRVWIGLDSCGTRKEDIVGWLLLTWQWNFMFNRRREISWPAEGLKASLEKLVFINLQIVIQEVAAKFVA
jgi:hypothetical protein